MNAFVVDFRQEKLLNQLVPFLLVYHINVQGALKFIEHPHKICRICLAG